jgi:crossover junction endodeoxyribonuclease RusA
MTFTVILPWPDRVLHPNSRCHWARKAKAVNRHRVLAGWNAKAASFPKLYVEALKVTVIFSPPDNRARDLDGMLSSIKAYLDGIADVVGVDDSKWHIEMCRGLPTKGGNVRITVEPADIWEHISEPLSRVVAAIPYPKKDVA